jgi:hypothetical protein
MNERIKQLAEQAGSTHKQNLGVYQFYTDELEKFAELIVKECKENFAKVWYEQGVDCRGAELGKFMTRFEEHFGFDECTKQHTAVID